MLQTAGIGDRAFECVPEITNFDISISEVENALVKSLEFWF